MRANISRCRVLKKKYDQIYEYNDNPYDVPDNVHIFLNQYWRKNNHSGGIDLLYQMTDSDLKKLEEYISTYIISPDWMLIFVNFGIIRNCHDNTTEKFLRSEKVFNVLDGAIKKYKEDPKQPEILKPGNFLDALIPETDPVTEDEISEPTILGDCQIYEFSTVLHFMETRRNADGKNFVSPICLAKIKNFGLIRKDKKWNYITF